MTILTTNSQKPAQGTPIPLRHLRVDDTKPKTFDFDAGQFKEAHPHASAFKKGPLQTSQLREMAENKARLAASAAKKAALAAQAAKGPAKRAGRKAKRSR
jgi:hypothetical protein